MTGGCTRNDGDEVARRVGLLNVFIGVHGVFEEGCYGHEADNAGDGGLMPYTGLCDEEPVGTEDCFALL